MCAIIKVRKVNLHIINILIIHSKVTRYYNLVIKSYYIKFKHKLVFLPYVDKILNMACLLYTSL